VGEVASSNLVVPTITFNQLRLSGRKYQPAIQPAIGYWIASDAGFPFLIASKYNP